MQGLIPSIIMFLLYVHKFLLYPKTGQEKLNLYMEITNN